MLLFVDRSSWTVAYAVRCRGVSSGEAFQCKLAFFQKFLGSVAGTLILSGDIRKAVDEVGSFDAAIVQNQADRLRSTICLRWKGMQTAFGDFSLSRVGTVLKDRMVSDRAKRNLEALASSLETQPSKLREMKTKLGPNPTPSRLTDQ